MRRTRTARVLTFVFTLLHLAVPLVAAIADARLTRDGVSWAFPAAHWEAPGSTHHPQVHPPDCALCHFLTAFRAPGARAAELPIGEIVAVVVDDAQLAIRADAGASILARPRAPPAS